MAKKNAEAETAVPEETPVGQMITADTPRHARTIGSKDGPSFTVQVPAPFAAGPITLTEGQAATLNQSLAENVSNNLRSKLVEGQTDDDGNVTAPHTDETAQALVDEYVSGYQFGGRKGGGGTRVTDPVEREARKLARQAATQLVKDQGLKVGDVDMKPLVEQIFEQNREALMAQGAEIVEASKATSGLKLEGLEVAKKEEEA